MSNKASNWFSLGTINKSKAGDAVAADSLYEFASSKKEDLKLTLKVNLKGKEEHLLTKGSFLIFNFQEFEGQKDFIVGRVSIPIKKGTETEFLSIGNLTKTKSTPQHLVDEFVNLARQTKINCKVYFTAKDKDGSSLDSVKIMNNDYLLLSFGRTEKEPDFVLGRVLLNLGSSN